jgi:hypothetical protein
VLIIASAIANLMAANISGNDLDQVLSAHLDSLAISPQVKQAILPALFGIAKFAETQAHRCVHHIRYYLFVHGFSLHYLYSCSSVAQPQAVIALLGFDYGPDNAHAGYQIYQQPFGSNMGSGYTIWYSSRSGSSIQSPPIVSQAKTGHLYVHFDTSTKTYQYWMLGTGGQWEGVSKNAQYPLNPDRVLSFRINGEPSWVTWATTHTTETRREKRARSVAG